MARKTTPPQPPAAPSIVMKSMEDVMHDSMMPYSEYVILERALPRVEDGLKPVQRRILYTMHELGLTPDKPHKKCARIVGDCLGKYHPHGDTSVYDALARMAQPFAMRGLLVDGHGNFGSIDGDSPAAMRYTEARMTPLAMELLRDIDKDTVDFRLNFDDSIKEPAVLPGRFPNLLVNGASGIAVGLATNIPPHNLRETIAAAIALIDDPKADTAALMRHLPAPDFPTGGILLKDEELFSAYETGRGKLTLRARVSVENGAAGRKLLVITEVPYQVSKSSMLERILKLSEEKKGVLSGIYDIRDESDRTGLRAVVELKKEVDPDKVLAFLYKYSDLQVTVGVNIVAIADGRPMQLGLRAVLARYVEHQKDVVTRRTRHELAQARARAHILEGLIIAVDHLDEVIRLIRSSKNPKMARDRLMEAYQLTEIQAQAILDMRLQRLTNLEIVALRQEYAEVKALIDRLTAILGSEKKLMAVIKKELAETAARYGDDRRTELSAGFEREIEIEPAETTPDEAVIALSEAGFVRRMAPRVYEKGAQSEPDEAAPRFLIKTWTDRRLMFFTDLGNCYALPVDAVPECRYKDRGIPLGGLLNGLETGESPVALICPEGDGDLMMFTELGQVKRTAIADLPVRRGKSAAIKLKAGDRLLVAGPQGEIDHAMLVTAQCMAIHFPLADVPRMGRAAAGVKAISLAPGDRVVAALPGGLEGEALFITDYGFAKRCLMVDFEPQARGGKGLRCMTLPKSGAVGRRIAAALRVAQPYDFSVRQKSGARTRLNTEQVTIELRAGKGQPYVIVAMDDVVVSAEQV
ncbi:MAG: DNA topoisomerase 4 subunit A [Clostridiales bacterium]|nr:DNA topoisomerase 4 subunit A [Clostridiales bacterium]